MKNNPQSINQRNQTKIMDWLSVEEQEDDFLLGKTPSEFQASWEDEE